MDSIAKTQADPNEGREVPRRRRGRHRDPVLAILRRGVAVSAQDVHAALRGTPAQLGLSTAYRELRALAQEGVVDVARVGDEMLYSLGDPQVTDLLVCSLCNRTWRSIRDPRLSEVLAAQGMLDGDRRSVVIQGRCRDCTVSVSS